MGTMAKGLTKGKLLINFYSFFAQFFLNQRSKSRADSSNGLLSKEELFERERLAVEMAEKERFAKEMAEQERQRRRSHEVRSSHLGPYVNGDVANNIDSVDLFGLANSRMSNTSNTKKSKKQSYDEALSSLAATLPLGIFLNDISDTVNEYYNTASRPKYR